jgi:hypothetical protein
LLRELISRTERTSKDYANLTKAREKVEVIVADVNAATNAHEQREKALALQAKIESPVVSNLPPKSTLLN